MQTVSVAIDDTTVFGPRSMACLSPIPPDFEEIAKNEGQSIYMYKYIHMILIEPV